MINDEGVDLTKFESLPAEPVSDSGIDLSKFESVDGTYWRG